MAPYTIAPRIILLAVFSSITILSLAFAGGDADSFRGELPNRQPATDTIPAKKRFQRNSMDDKSFQDDAIDMKAVEDAMRNIERSMQKLKAELGQDYQRHIKDSYQKAFDEINWKKIQGGYEKAIAEVQENQEFKKMNKQFNLQRQQMMSDLNRQMELSRLNMEKGMKSMQLALKVDMDRQLQKARIQLQKAKVQLGEINNFKTDLEKDGLIKAGESYDIEIKDGDLYINGKKQKSKVSKKYKEKYPRYFEQGQQFKLNNDNKKSRRIEVGDGGLV